jgi:zinc protease
MNNPLQPLVVHRHTLSNGLEVFLVEERSLPIVAVNINYRVGSKDEKPGRTGLAHLFEHMMFEGSKHSNEDFFKPLQELGAIVNGGTSCDRTRYWVQLPSEYLERALWLEADRMGFLLDAISQERLDNQRSVVVNERRQRYENSPYGLLGETRDRLLYPPHHPYSWPTIGAIADLEAVSLEDLHSFFGSYYAPNNASLAIVGDIEVETSRASVEKYFGAIPPGPPVTRLERWTPRLDDELRVAMEDRVQLPRMSLTWPTVARFAPDDAELDVLARVLGGARTSRLYQRLVHEQQIAQDASAFHTSMQLAGFLDITLTPRPGHTLDELEGAARQLLAELLDAGISIAELDRVQHAITAEVLRGRERIGGFAGVSDRLNDYHHHLGQPDMYRWDLQRYLDLDPESVTCAARRHLERPLLALRVDPVPAHTASTSPLALSIDRTRPPARGSSQELNLPATEVFTLANGLRVILAERRELPLVTCKLLIDGGAAADPPQLSGLASLTMDLLREGAGGRSALAVAEELEGLGSVLSSQASREHATVTLSSLGDSLKESLDLFALVALRPDFGQPEVERQRARRLVRLSQLEDRADFIAQRALRKVVFDDHPYARPIVGTRAGVASISDADPRSCWMTTFNPATATLIVVGESTRRELDRFLHAHFETWTAPSSTPAAVATPDPLRKRRVFLVDKAGAQQSEIVIGLIGAPRNGPDYEALELLNTVLGGQFTSRLNLNLREEKGYTYGVRSDFEYGRASGLFSVATSVQTDVTAPALREIMTELDEIRGHRPVTPSELDYAKGTLTNGYPHRFESNSDLAAELVEEVVCGLPQGSLAGFPDAVRRVDLAAVTAAAHRMIRPEIASIVIVGDLGRIRAEVERLELGPVVVLDREGEPLPE